MSGVQLTFGIIVTLVGIGVLPISARIRSCDVGAACASGCECRVLLRDAG